MWGFFYLFLLFFFPLFVDELSERAQEFWLCVSFDFLSYICRRGADRSSDDRLWLVPLLLSFACSSKSSLERAWRTTRESLLSFFCFYILAVLQLLVEAVRVWRVSFVVFYMYGCEVRPVSFACLLSWRDMTCRPLFLVFLLSSFSFVFFFCYICLECVLRAELEMMCLAARSLLFLLYMRRYWRGQRRRQWQRL